MAVFLLFCCLWVPVNSPAQTTRGSDAAKDSAIKNDPSSGEGRDLNIDLDLEWTAKGGTGTDFSQDATFHEKTTIQTKIYRYRNTPQSAFLISVASGSGTIQTLAFGGTVLYPAQGVTLTAQVDSASTAQPRLVTQKGDAASDLFTLTTQALPELSAQTYLVTDTGRIALPPYKIYPVHDFDIEGLSYTTLLTSPITKTITNSWSEVQNVTASGTAIIWMSKKHCEPLEGLKQGEDFDFASPSDLTDSNGKVARGKTVEKSPGKPFVFINQSVWDGESAQMRNSTVAHEMEHARQIKEGRMKEGMTPSERFKLEYEGNKAQADYIRDCVDKTSLSDKEKAEAEAKTNAFYNTISGKLRDMDETRLFLESSFGYRFSGGAASEK